jgi:hypothetical protein
MADSAVRISELQRAFALAMKCSERDNTPARERNEFRAVAHLIWRSCGDVVIDKPSREIGKAVAR